MTDKNAIIIEEHNKRAAKAKYEEWIEKSEQAPVGYNEFGGEGSNRSWAFVKTADGHYATKTIEESTVKQGSYYYTFEGVIPVEVEGETKEYFLHDYKYASYEPNYVSGFAYNPENGEVITLLGEDEKMGGPVVEGAFQALKEQALKDEQAQMPSEQN